MADLYGRSTESEDISFLQILVNSSSVAATTSTSPDGLFCGAPLLAGSSCAVNFSDPSTLYGKESEGITSSAKLGNFASSFEEAEASESRAKAAQPCSSKRSRAAEIHNQSEKRRRSRINEKLKALQNLVPNSSKTDKASMLDEAIEYLKQLQLQVQMLTMRNGLSLHPLGSTLVPQSDVGRMLHNSLEQEIYGQTAFETCNHASAAQPIVIPSSIINSTPQITAGQNIYGLVDHLASSKDICCDSTPSRFQFDTSFSGNNSSPGVSS